MEAISEILLPLDNSEVSRTCIAVARDAAKRYGAEIAVFGCINLVDITGPEVEMSPVDFNFRWDEAKRELLAHLDAVVRELGDAGVVARSLVVAGRPAEQILRRVASRKNVDLIVMTSNRRSGFRRWMTRSVTDSVLRHSTCPVLVVPCESKHPPTVWCRIATWFSLAVAANTWHRA